MTSIWILLFIFPTKTYAYSFCEEAWRKSHYIYAKILVHPFNQELESGTLPLEKFQFYQAQDKIYLKVFTQVLTKLSSMVEDAKTKKIIAQLTSESLNEIPESSAKSENIFLTPATFHYGNFLRAQSAHKSAAELSATLLPCYWIYLELAQSMKKKMKADNPYKKWIDTYSSNGYRTSVQQMKEIVEHLSGASDAKTQSAMFQAYLDASKLELAFWDDSYHGAAW